MPKRTKTSTPQKTSSLPLREWTIAAVDPGVQPTIAILLNRGEELTFYEGDLTSVSITGTTKTPRVEKGQYLPCPRKISAILDIYRPDLVVLENVWVRPGQGIVSQAKLVMSLGMVLGISVGLGLNVLRATPQTWMAYHGLLKTTKNFHVEAARSLCPAHLQHLFLRAKDHNRADAYLMGLFGLAYLDAAFETAIKKHGAPYDIVPPIYAIR